MTMQAHKLTQAALGTVACDRTAEVLFPRNDRGHKTAVSRSVGNDKRHKTAMHAAPGGKDHGEITLAVEARRSAQARRGRGVDRMRTGRRSRHSYLDSDALAAACSAAAEHFPAAACTHAHTETVSFLAVPLRRLKCTFHSVCSPYRSN